MLKSELIAKIQETTGISKKEASDTFDKVLTTVIDGLKSDGVLQIPEFGTFKLKTRPARLGPKPGTKEKIMYPESTTVVFKASKRLKATL